MQRKFIFMGCGFQETIKYFFKLDSNNLSYAPNQRRKYHAYV